MFLVPRDKLPGCVRRSVGPAWLLRKDFVVAGTRALEFDECCAVCGLRSWATRFSSTRALKQGRRVWQCDSDSPV